MTEKVTVPPEPGRPAARSLKLNTGWRRGQGLMSLKRLDCGAQRPLCISEELPEQQGKQFFVSICSFRKKYSQGTVTGEG